ncbi:hypothetical protein BST81_12210 [Leptolyngbya sp. 'hensonii']|uniref:chemotaxis protein CheW n=1 Tax=Leptolyngbya sp. 'hensonii' TaxID=1922337 RepID=UPI0009501841|nr:chemotaxis protein CheW [Leptolyngbya sp. 'hensonii']OLP17823.1 hypothetical protein BST81_12210 [Leptolyngbya sp. 'hensonii']
MSTPLAFLPPDRPQKSSGEPYLKVYLNGQTAALIPMASAQEVLVLPVQQLTPMPGMPACVLGLINRRSRVLWLIDLAHLLGLSPLEETVRQYNVVLIRVADDPLALALWAVRHGVRFNPEDLQPVQGTVRSELRPYLQGMLLQDTEVLLVLDPAAIVRSPLLPGRESFS